MANIIYLFFNSQKLFGNKNFLPQSALIKFFAIEFCSKKPISVLCGNIFFLLCGFDEKNLNMVSFFSAVRYLCLGLKKKNPYICISLTPKREKKIQLKKIFNTQSLVSKIYKNATTLKMLLQSHGIFFSLSRPERLFTRHTAQLEHLSRT